MISVRIWRDEKCKRLHTGKFNDNAVNHTLGELVLQRVGEEKDVGVSHVYGGQTCLCPVVMFVCYELV